MPGSLTAEQREAVMHGTGPLLIFAGPGSGKTFTITHRIAYLLASGAATAAQILAVTFTVRAAAEMKLRLIKLLGNEAVEGLTVRTFHSVCALMLRPHAAVFGRDEHFTIYDEHEIRSVLEARLVDAPSTAIQHLLEEIGEVPVADVKQVISLGKNRMLDPGAYESSSEDPAAPLIAACWRELDEELAASNAMDFDDLLVYAVRLLLQHRRLAQHFKDRWRWILVDEYQDTNVAQAQLLRLLSGPNGNVTVVGDDDQALYSWRAADVENILRFDRQYPRHHTITLATNFRSRQEIVDAAARLIEHNFARHPKRLEAVRGSGGSAELAQFGSDESEAAWVADQIAWYLEHGVELQEILVMIRSLGRRGRLIRPLERELVAHGIPYRVVGALGLYERKEVRDALGYLALLSNPYDAGAFARAIAFPTRGVGKVTIAALVSWARENEKDLLSACELATVIPGLRTRGAREELELFSREMARVRELLPPARSLTHAVSETLGMRGGPVSHLEHVRDHAPRAEEREDAERVLQDLRSLVNAVSAFEAETAIEPTLGAFLAEAVGLDTTDLDEEDAGDCVSLMTIHKAKGLQARVCYVLGCEEGLLPVRRALMATGGGRLDEERRGAYVAITRTQDRFYFCCSARRGDRRTDGLSRFVREALAVPAAEATPAAADPADHAALAAT